MTLYAPPAWGRALPRLGAAGDDLIRMMGQSRGKPGWRWITPMVMLAVLLPIARVNFLLFHTAIELVSIVIAASLLPIAVVTRRLNRDDFLLFLGGGYVWIALIDLMHTLAYKGFGVFPGIGADPATQAWVLGRGLEAGLLALAPGFLAPHKSGLSMLSDRPWLGFNAIGAAALTGLSLIALGAFPAAFNAGSGLTGFKIAMEWLAIGLLALAGWRLWQARAALHADTLALLMAALALSAAAELAFTLYTDIYGLTNMAGHLLRLLSYWMVFLALIDGALARPFSALAHEALTYEAMPYPVLLVDHDGAIQQVNRAALRGLDHAGDVWHHQSVHGFFHGSETGRDQCPVCRATGEGRTLPPTEIRLAESGRVIEFTVSPLQSARQAGLMVMTARDITGEARLRDQLMRARDEAERATAAKDRVLANMSHEFRTPLNAIIGFAEMIRLGVYGPLGHPRYAGYVDDIAAGAHNLMDLVDRLLELNALEAGHYALKAETVALAGAVSDAAGLLDRWAAEADVVIETRVEPPDATLETDPGALEEILVNLVGNAVRFSPMGSRVRLSVRRSAEGGEIEVADDGPGIDPAVLAHLETPFDQGREAYVRHGEGVGLGLVITRDLARRLGGALIIDSVPGKGTRAIVRLPMLASSTARSPSPGRFLPLGHAPTP